MKLLTRGCIGAQLGGAANVSAFLTCWLLHFLEMSETDVAAQISGYYCR